MHDDDHDLTKQRGRAAEHVPDCTSDVRRGLSRALVRDLDGEVLLRLALRRAHALRFGPLAAVLYARREVRS